MNDLRMASAWAALGVEVKRLRQLRGMKQGELAGAVGTSQIAVSRDERGYSRGGIPADRLNGYIRVLGLERDYVHALLNDSSALPTDETLTAQLDAVATIPDLDEATRRKIVSLLRRTRALTATTETSAATPVNQ